MQHLDLTGVREAGLAARDPQLPQIAGDPGSMRNGSENGLVDPVDVVVQLLEVLVEVRAELLGVLVLEVDGVVDAVEGELDALAGAAGKWCFRRGRRSVRR